MDELPEIYWYIFWIGLALIAFGSAYLGGRAAHRERMRALDVLKTYAEKGAEPPPALMDRLAAQVFDKPSSATHGARANLLQAFIGFLFMGCASWAVYAWLDGSGGPLWATAAAVASAAFFGFGALGFLLAALLTRQK